jgi:4-hydroxythreonine-4-phosphate dehydrogenase
MKDKIRVGITHGDFNGISYEIIMKTFSDASISEFFTPVVYGSAKAAAYYRKVLNLEQFNFNQINDVNEMNPKKINILNVSDNVKVEMGTPTPASKLSAMKALDAATADLRDGKIDVIVTCPTDKSNSASELPDFTGHTEYFADKFSVADYMLVMISDLMKIGFVTGNISLMQAAESINTDLILSKLYVLNNCLKTDFIIRAPRIAVLSLNPHDDKEEKDIIRPVIEEAKSRGILAFGTYSSDGFFASGAFRNFDAILAMYYDQGMIPFKSIGLSRGVNYTAGLPVVRTSPAHGAGHDIAGKGLALPNSLRDAIFLAAEIHSNRSMQSEIIANPLQSKMEHRSETR